MESSSNGIAQKFIRFEHHLGMVIFDHTTLHELGHAFGLQHDWRDDTHLMSYGGNYATNLSKCAAEWLSVHKYFNHIHRDKKTITQK